jgi:DNA-directed RNA polymerase sigma subunit (sigma70/sigma32)
MPPLDDPSSLVTENLGLVRMIALALLPTLPAGFELEDLVGWGNIGLLSAARTYDPSRGASFVTWAGHKIEWAIRDGMIGEYRWLRARASGVSAEHLLDSRAPDEGLASVLPTTLTPR